MAPKQKKSAADPGAAASDAPAPAVPAASKSETLHQMKQRHKQELKDLASSKDVKGKGGNKKLKEMEAALSAKHAAEIAAFQKRPKPATDSDGEAADAPADAAAAPKPAAEADAKAAPAAAPGADAKTAAPAAGAGVGAGASSAAAAAGAGAGAGAAEGKQSPTFGPLRMGAGHAKLSKAAAKKASKATKARERDAELRAANAGAVDMRAVEMAQIMEQLKPMRLCVRDIAADGHCLFRAVDDQLTLYPAENKALAQADPKCPAPRWMVLRQMAADYMAAHADEYRPYLVDDNGDVMDQTAFAAYCAASVAPDPVQWGGQHEINALTRVLNRTIVVHSAKAAPLTTAPEPPKDKSGKPIAGAGAAPLTSPLRIAFHDHYYGLGAHYNSVVPDTGAAKK